jgi:hypothetical protein
VRCSLWHCHIKSLSATTIHCLRRGLDAADPRCRAGDLRRWFVVAHADGFLPAVGPVAGLGPGCASIGLAIVASACSIRGLRPVRRSSSCIAGSPGAMLHLRSLLRRWVVRSGRAHRSGVPYLAHVIAPAMPKAGQRGYLATKLAETVSALLPDQVHRLSPARRQVICTEPALGHDHASAAYAVVITSSVIIRRLAGAASPRMRGLAFPVP